MRGYNPECIEMREVEESGHTTIHGNRIKQHKMRWNIEVYFRPLTHLYNRQSWIANFRLGEYCFSRMTASTIPPVVTVRNAAVHLNFRERLLSGDDY